MPSLVWKSLSSNITEYKNMALSPATEIGRLLADVRLVTLKVLDALAREVATLVHEKKLRGAAR